MTQQMPPPAAEPVFPPPGWFPQQPPAPRNGFGIVALCLALVGLLFGMVPFTGVVAVILGLLALVLGFLGYGRVQQGIATNKKMTLTGTALGLVALVLGVLGLVYLFQMTSTATTNSSNATSGYSSSQTAPVAPAPASPVPVNAAPAKPTSYTYEVTGNYPASFFDYTDSNGDSIATYQQESGLGDHSKKLPWSKTVTPEPNGGVNSLGAQTTSSKGDAWITCTVKDDKGAVVSLQTKRGAYAQCYASSIGTF
jgi:hypothetical protein